MILLLYKIPSEPTARRVYVWRKMKRLGAVLLHDSIWCLPNRAWTKEQFQWLAVEIDEMGGKAMLWESKLSLVGDEEELIYQFQTQVDMEYSKILTKIEGEHADLGALSKRYQQTLDKDYFQSSLGKQVREALSSARGGMKI